MLQPAKIATPFNKWFSDLTEADKKLDIMQRVVLRLQGGELEQDPRLVVNLRKSYGDSMQIWFGGFVVFRYPASTSAPRP